MPTLPAGEIFCYGSQPTWGFLWIIFLFSRNRRHSLYPAWLYFCVFLTYSWWRIVFSRACSSILFLWKPFTLDNQPDYCCGEKQNWGVNWNAFKQNWIPRGGGDNLFVGQQFKCLQIMKIPRMRMYRGSTLLASSRQTRPVWRIVFVQYLQLILASQDQVANRVLRRQSVTSLTMSDDTRAPAVTMLCTSEREGRYSYSDQAISDTCSLMMTKYL